MKNLLSIKNVSKNYYGNPVLKNVNIDIKSGEILALVGENGAGKSTLMNILFGMPTIFNTGGYDGTIEIDGLITNIKSPFEAMRSGIGMVHQEFMLIPGFSITENIKINREITKPNIISRITSEQLKTLDMGAMHRDARKALDTLDIGIEEFALVAGLPVGHMQFIEIAREIDKVGLKILVFDEPTAVLTESEAQNLLNAMRVLAGKGIGIIFISHRLDEVVRISDKVAILRDGELVSYKSTSESNVIEIAQKMVGREFHIETRDIGTISTKPEAILSVTDLFVEMPGEKVKGISFDVHKGEIFGVGGLAGQGKLGIANGLMGLYPTTGKVVLDGKELELNNPKISINSGLGFVSEDRKGVGLLLNESIEMNIVFTDLQLNNNYLRSWGVVKIRDLKKIRTHAVKMIRDLDIRCLSPRQPTGRLSGGNQQKVCIARALTLNPKVLLISEPTRGIDIGAKKLILDLLMKLKNELNMTIIMISSELAELRSICDRIMIICEGEIAGELSPMADDVEFGLMMSGSKGMSN